MPRKVPGHFYEAYDRMHSIFGDTPAIDIVYTWVDGGSQGFSEQVEFWRGKESATRGNSLHPEAVAPHRFREMDNLRHSLRSVVKNLPWVRKFFYRD